MDVFVEDEVCWNIQTVKYSILGYVDYELQYTGIYRLWGIVYWDIQTMGYSILGYTDYEL